MAQDSEYFKFQKLYKGSVMEEFEEDYKTYRTVNRTLKSYYKSPSSGKLHLLYNKLVVLRRVFPEKFLYHEIITSATNMYTKNLISFFLNECFNTIYRIDIVDDIWDENIEELRDKGSIKFSI